MAANVPAASSTRRGLKLPQPARLPQSVSALHHCKLDEHHTIKHTHLKQQQTALKLKHHKESDIGLQNLSRAVGHDLHGFTGAYTDWLKLSIAGCPTSSQTSQNDGIWSFSCPSVFLWTWLTHLIPDFPNWRHTANWMLQTDCRQVQRKMAANVPRRLGAASLSCLHGCRNPYPRPIHICKQAQMAKHCTTQHGRHCKWEDQLPAKRNTTDNQFVEMCSGSEISLNARATWAGLSQHVVWNNY